MKMGLKNLSSSKNARVNPAIPEDEMKQIRDALNRFALQADQTGEFGGINLNR